MSGPVGADLSARSGELTPLLSNRTPPIATCAVTTSCLARTDSTTSCLAMGCERRSESAAGGGAQGLSSSVTAGWGRPLLQGSATEVPPRTECCLLRRGVHRHLLALPWALAHAMGMVGQPRGPSQRLRPADMPGESARWFPTPQRRAAPAGGAKRETARALHADTSRRFQQERLNPSTGYSGAHRPAPPAGRPARPPAEAAPQRVDSKRRLYATACKPSKAGVRPRVRPPGAVRWRWPAGCGQAAGRRLVQAVVASSSTSASDSTRSWPRALRSRWAGTIATPWACRPPP
jgi:hypothetical protein